MGNSKLMRPLFLDTRFNREGRKMRAVFEREISDGAHTYRIWRRAGKPELKYNRNENDNYILYVEVNGYLAPLGMTEFSLIDQCGFGPAAEKLYGGRENRGKWIDSLRESGGSDAIHAAVAEELAEVKRYGSDPARQTARIHSLLSEHVSRYLKSKESGGETFPDFVGALVMDDLAQCVELSAIYRAKLLEKDEARRALAAEEERAYCEEQNRAAEEAVSEAVQIILNGGVLKNEEVRFYRSKYDYSIYSIVNHLMRLYRVDVPLRTQGWINERLSSATIQNGKCEQLQYFRRKNGQCSQKFFECMNDLIRAVTAQASEDAA